MENLFNLEFVEILNTGLGGFCFLVALLSYLLLVREQKKEQPSLAILKSIKSFTFYTLCFGVLVLAGTIVIALIDQGGTSDDGNAVREFIALLPPEVRDENPNAVVANVNSSLQDLKREQELVKDKNDEISELQESNRILTEEKTTLATEVSELKRQQSLDQEELNRLRSNSIISLIELNKVVVTEFTGSVNPVHPYNDKKRDMNARIQQALAEVNYYSGPIDGDGARTREALVSYQLTKSMSKTGYFAWPTMYYMIMDHLEYADLIPETSALAGIDFFQLNIHNPELSILENQLTLNH